MICDLTEKMRAYAKGSGLVSTPDNLGYFGHNPSYGAYMEVISFEKLVSDAQRRNAVFFEKLNLGRDILDKPNGVSNEPSTDEPKAPSTSGANGQGH